MGVFWECRTCFEQHDEPKAAERCCDNRKAALEERAAVVAYVRSKDSYDFDDLANDFEAGEHLK